MQIYTFFSDWPSRGAFSFSSPQLATAGPSPNKIQAKKCMLTVLETTSEVGGLRYSYFSGKILSSL